MKKVCGYVDSHGKFHETKEEYQKAEGDIQYRKKKADAWDEVADKRIKFIDFMNNSVEDEYPPKDSIFSLDKLLWLAKFKGNEFITHIYSYKKAYDRYNILDDYQLSQYDSQQSLVK